MSTPTAESPEIPATMKRLVVKAPGDDVASCKIEIQEVPVPEPKSGQVLVKVAAAAVNPSDYGSWIKCKATEENPFAMGKEGCGIVVKSGGGYLASLYAPVGTPVGFVGLKENQGSYSEYVVVDAFDGIFPLPTELPIEDAASFFVNPYTAVAILDTAKSEGCNAIIHTAAASQLGQMLVKLAPQEGMEIINVVRRDEQAELLKGIGAKHVIVTSNNDEWKDTLKEKIKQLDVKIAFDAVAGKMTGDLVQFLPPKGIVHVYGVLAGHVENVDPIELIYNEKIVKGLFLTAWIKEGGLLSMVPRMLRTSKKVNAGLASGGWSSTQFKDTTLETVQQDLVKLLQSSITGQKLRVRFNQSSS